MNTRKQNTREIVKLLVFYIFILLIIISIFLSLSGKSNLVLIVFLCGVIGGFVSIYQRLHNLDDSEIEYLSSSKSSLLIIPLIGGVFSLVLLLMFLGNLVQGELFPIYNSSEFKISNIKTFYFWLENNYPKTGEDVAKLLFWSFVAGFSERFVPRLINNLENSKIKQNKINKKDKF